ncbi:alpha-lactalbumin-like [Fundulus heteroclitus]|uniref:alpha-lactalbumin-like n=1 Tax=Fundulus heteroclitus TaxID=8078 RepID=UPI00165AA189|nr:alpha-lactalbumin-like [Fundulus heteroclitus]
MKVLVLFAFAVLGSALVGAKTLTKCEMKQLMGEVFNSLPDSMKQSGLSGDRFVAKVVCHVEQLSGFNTSTVTELRREKGQGSSESGSESGSESAEGSRSKGKHQSGKKQGGRSNEDDQDMNLYGLFQLAEGLVCSSENNTLPNLCGISCNKLIDDDISDDINCLVKLLTEIVKNGFTSEHSKGVWKAIKKLIDDKCKNVDQYFSDC